VDLSGDLPTQKVSRLPTLQLAGGRPTTGPQSPKYTNKNDMYAFSTGDFLDISNSTFQ